VIESLLTSPSGSIFDADVCVVGAGPVGLAVAREFLDERGTRVVLLESGGEKLEAAVQTLNRGVSPSTEYLGLEEGRSRAFGGTLWRWAGQCVRPDHEVFQPRPWIGASGWPIPADALDPYLPRASDFFQLPRGVLDSDAPVRFGLPELRLDPAAIREEPCVYVHPLNPARSRLGVFRRSQAVTTLLHATATRLVMGPSDTAATEVEVASLNGVRARVRAGVFVLACGGIENPRLLLTSGSFAKRLGALGRFLHDHPLAECATVDPHDRALLLEHATLLRRRRRGYRLRFALGAERQASAGVMACHAHLGWSAAPSLDTLRAVRPDARGLATIARHSGPIVRDLPALTRAAGRRLRGRQSAPRSGPIRLVVGSEQRPDPANRVTLLPKRDPLGVPMASVTWEAGEAERATMREMVATLDGEFRRTGLATVRPAAWLDDPDEWRAHVYEALHHMGTTRMSTSPSDGVVDANGRVHATDNVFVAGTSVFPVGGGANPTFGAVALALRLADHLKSRRGHRG
jgi:choline dehydrogenase-like flavoprotein